MYPDGIAPCYSMVVFIENDVVLVKMYGAIGRSVDVKNVVTN